MNECIDNERLRKEGTVLKTNCIKEPLPPTPYQRVKEVVKVKPKCNSKGVCDSCGKNQYPYTKDGFSPNHWVGYNTTAGLVLNSNEGESLEPTKFGQRPYPPINGWFNYDLVNGIIKLDGSWEAGDKLLFMYSTDMVERDGQKLVPVETFNLLLYRCKELLWNRNRPDQEGQRMKYELEAKRVKRLYNKMTKQEWEEAIGGYKYSSVKR